MSARIPIGWKPVVAGEKIPVASVIEIRKDLDDFGEFIRNTNPVYEWGSSRQGSIYRVVEQEEPPLEYPVEPVLTEEEMKRVVKMVFLGMAGSGAWDKWAMARVAEMVERALRQITREVER